MDGWPRIPNPGTSGKSPRTTATSLPAPGSTVVAAVEEDLGDGMYSLRWAGQKIHVSSRAPLAKGQALLLKSETSPEGKPRLVVVGPAPEQAAIVGKVIYGPKKHAAQQPQAEQAQPQTRESSLSRSRIGGNIVDTGGSSARPDAGAAGQAGGQMAAGVSRAAAARAPEFSPELIGQVLEPLPELEVTAKNLLAAVKEEMTLLGEKEKPEQSKQPRQQQREPEAEAGQKQNTQEKPSAQAPQTSQPQPRPAAPAASAPGAPAAQQPPSAQQPAGTQPAPAARPDAAAQQPPPSPAPQPSAMPAASGQQQHPAPPPSGQTAPGPLPGTVLPDGGGPVVPDVPAGENSPQPQTRPAAPPAPPPTGAQPPAAARPDAPVTPRPLPQPLPGTPAPQSQPPATPGQAAPPPTLPPGQPQPPQQPPAVSPAPAAPGQQPPAPVPGTPQLPVPPGQPAPPQPSTPQPLPGVILADSGGPAVPDAPADQNSSPPQTQQPAQTRPAAPPPSAGTPAPQPPPAAPAQQPPAAPNQPRPAPVQPAPPPAPSGPQAAPPSTPTPPAQPEQTPVPQAPTPLPAGTYPRPATAIYSRPAQQQSYAANSPAGSAEAPEASRPSPKIKPEMMIKEALGQMVGAAEIPLGNPETDAARLGAGNKMPEAVLDKAAAILLRGAGLTPDPETMEAAKALVANNVQVDRENVQALLSAAAGLEIPEEREAVLRAAARLLSKDIPLSPPLVSGMADVVARKATAHQLMDAATKALAPDAATAAAAATTPEAEPLMAQARELLDMLHVDLERGDAAAALERYMSTFGREALGRALALVETSAQAVLEGNPQLQKIDQALTAILTRLQPEMEQAAQPQTPSAPPPQQAQQTPTAPTPTQTPPPAVAPAPVPQADMVEILPAPAPLPAQPRQPSQTPPVHTPEEPAPPPAQPPQSQSAPLPQTIPHAIPNRPINAYLNAPKALPIEEMLKNLPPMPKVVSLGTPPQPVPAVPPMMLPGQMANLANLAGTQMQSPAPALPPSTAQQSIAQTLPQILPQMQGETPHIPQLPSAETSATAEPSGSLDPEQIFRQAEALRRQSGVLNKLGTLFQIPGLNRQELELLRPGGFLDKFMNSAADRPDAAQVKADAEKLLRELISDNPRTAERARQELPQRENAVLKEAAARLTRMEADVVRADPLMSKLSDAATSLRDLGRQLLAVKAENLALQDRNPGVMLAEVPFKLNDDAGDGRMQMFYRRGKKKGDGWSSRVILDLNTTRMGPVLGDMRFFGQEMTLNMFVDRQDAADYLSGAAEELAGNLEKKGFRSKMKFMVLPPPPPPPVLDGERPEISGEETVLEQIKTTVRSGKRGGLDIET